jgi:hypothetical protein
MFLLITMGLINLLIDLFSEDVRSLMTKATPRILCEDVRVVKEYALRASGEIRVGSNPTPRIFFAGFIESMKLA